ncbi:hypothetical protein [Streptomyces sp. NPDC053427]|uniref:hypothetical protein n=1 Tax=Streptomyces sp. NPDC053427 TaxID=3365701 RepID=UPI0037D86B68
MSLREAQIAWLFRAGPCCPENALAAASEAGTAEQLPPEGMFTSTDSTTTRARETELEADGDLSKFSPTGDDDQPALVVAKEAECPGSARTMGLNRLRAVLALFSPTGGGSSS